MNPRDTYMWKELWETPAVLSKLYNNNAKTVQKIAETVRKRHIGCIYAVGRGTSDHALLYFKYAAEILGKAPVALGACSILTLYGGRLDLTDSLVVGCSQSGRAADVTAVLERARAQGGVTVSVTNEPESPVAETADFDLHCEAGREVSVAATKTFSAELYLLAMLAAELGEAEPFRAELLALPARLEKILPAVDGAAERAAEFFRGMQDGFLLARGLGYPIALEGALKLQETSYVRVKGYAVSDFYHGPMAMVAPRTPVFVYVPKDTFGGGQRRDGQDCIARMEALGAKVLAVTDDETLDAGPVETVRLPGLGSGFASVFSLALFAQMFACKFSCALGNDPDCPRALRKVTVTR